VFDHDWATLATGVAILMGCTMTHNVGYIQIGTSHDTSEFACDSIRYWWNTYGKGHYPLADSICYVMVAAAIAHVTTSQAGPTGVGQRVRNQIRIAHHPPYTSKYNPIEHRLFLCLGVSGCHSLIAFRPYKN